MIELTVRGYLGDWFERRGCRLVLQGCSLVRLRIWRSLRTWRGMRYVAGRGIPRVALRRCRGYNGWMMYHRYILMYSCRGSVVENRQVYSTQWVV